MQYEQLYNQVIIRICHGLFNKFGKIFWADSRKDEKENNEKLRGILHYLFEKINVKTINFRKTSLSIFSKEEHWPEAIFSFSVDSETVQANSRIKKLRQQYRRLAG